MNQEAYAACWKRLENNPGALRALLSLSERGSLDSLDAQGFAGLDAELIHWLLRAESHAGSEIVYSFEGKGRGLPLGSFFDFPERYAAKIPGPAYISAETAAGGSRVLYVASCTREKVLSVLEQAQQSLALSSDRPLRERILDNLREAGHLSCLSADGLAHLDARLVKYLDYAVNVRPGSELIYTQADGEIKAEALELAFQQPDSFAAVPLPVFLAIEIDGQSVLFDTQDISPANLWRLQKKARQVVESREAKA